MKLTAIFLLLSCCAFGQSDSLAELCRMCDSIQLSQNLEAYYKKLDAAAESPAKTRVKIVQIGDSHVQMGHFPGGIEAEMRKDHPTLANVSFRFPYALTYGFNPKGIRVDTTGAWTGEKMVGSPAEKRFALSGHALVLKTAGDKTPFLRLEQAQQTDMLEVLIETNDDWHFSADSAKVKTRKIGGNLSIVTLRSDGKKNVFYLNACCAKNDPRPLRVFGFRSAEPENGMLFESYGSSGGKYSDYITKCDFCPEQLSYAAPDLFIVSLGTNDAFGTYAGESYYESVAGFIAKIKEENPHAAILLTTQPDTYYKEQKPASDSIVHAALLRVAAEYHCALWDLAAVMGGQNSIHYWFSEGLAGTDMLHFTEKGYAFQAMLLVEALNKGYAAYREQEQ